MDYTLFFVLAGAMVSWLHLRARFDVVQVNTMPDFLVFCTAVPKLMGARIVIHMKEPTPELGEMLLGGSSWPRLLVWIEQAAIRWSDIAITVTEELRQTYIDRGADPDKVRVVLTGNPSAAFAHVDESADGDPDHFTLICHGAVEARYGHDLIVQAIALARREVPNVRFRFTGVGPEVDHVLTLAEELGVSDHVECLGWLDLDQLAKELAQADAGLVTQFQSSYSDLVHTNKMYEYMIFRKPVIAGRLLSVSHYFDDDSIQFFEPGDAASLADAIVTLAKHPERRAQLVEGASKRFDEYRWERQSDAYLQVFRDLGVDFPTDPRRVAA